MPALTAALFLGSGARRLPTELNETAWCMADDFASAAVLGSATTAMLMGHSYLIAPAMSLTPLERLLGPGPGPLGAHGPGRARSVVVDGALRPAWRRDVLWPVRWLFGFWGRWSWAGWLGNRSHSLDTVGHRDPVRGCDLCFLGELTGQLLLEKTGYIL